MAYRYGESLEKFEPLNEARNVALVDHVSELLPTTGKLYRYCEEVWQAVRPKYSEATPTSAVRDLLGFIEGKAHYTFQNTSRALEEEIQAHRDPRAYIICFYRRYREWRDWIHKVCGYLGTNVRVAPYYVQWWAEDDKWRDQFWQKIASPNLSQVRNWIIEYDREHGEMTPMPKPEPT